MDQNDESQRQWKQYVRLKKPSAKHVRVRARKIEAATVRHAHRFIISRWANLRDVRRHVVGWVVLAGLIIVMTGVQLVWIQRAYVSSSPIEGGTYAEGVIGRVDTLNPIYATTQSERSATHLLFSSLLRYDEHGSLGSDLASGYSRSDDGKTYTVSLRQDATWHDGKPVTAGDVVYTLNVIKNPVARSYLYSTWQDIKVKKLSDYEVQFSLPAAFAPFPHALTFGILPKHVLGQTSAARLREHRFNREPIGSGPFVFQDTKVINPDAERSVVQAVRNDDYYAGPVKLDRFQIHTYKTHDELRQGFLTREINAASNVSTSDIKTIQEVSPTTVVADAKVSDGVYAFFRNDAAILSDVQVRKALLLATDRGAIVKEFKGLASKLEGPLISDQLSGAIVDKQAGYDEAAASAALEAAGWVLDGKVRQKEGKKLELSVIAPKTGDFPKLLKLLTKQWTKVGVEVNSQLIDTDTFEQTVIKPRGYDVLLYELALGADPDVFAYWHSSQATVRGYNLSNYKSGIADDALMSARARVEQNLRVTKYDSFIKQWLADAPAVALYQPHLHYITTSDIKSVDPDETVVDVINRYTDISQWTVQKADRFKTP